MITTALSSRARITGLVAAAGLATLVAAGSANAADTNTSGADVPRLELSSEIWCYQGDLGSVTFYYDDLADGHVPQQVHEEVSDGSGVVWTRDDLYQEFGNYFNTEVFSFVGGTAPFDRNVSLTYTVTMTYDDGVTQTQSTAIDLAPECTGTTPTTAPTTVAPAEPDRFGLWASGFWCGGEGTDAYVSWHYTDYPDGHYAAQIELDLLKNGAAIDRRAVINPDPTSDGAETDFTFPSDLFSVRTIEVASYSLAITVTYEDGATDKHVETFDLDQICDGRVNGQTAATVPATTTGPSDPGATTTTVPRGTLPETGSSNLTWVIGAVAGLLTTAGAALFAGVRRSRND
jgi:LPXTG-motif cell wall-anchored protein